MNYWDLSFQEVQQSLSEKIEEADKMIKTLDSCIDELKTGMAVFPNMKLCPFFAIAVSFATTFVQSKASDVSAHSV